MMTIGRSLGVLAALLIGSEFAPAQEVTVSGRLVAQAGSLAGKHYVQAYTIDSRPDNPLRSVQVSSTDFDAVLIVVAPDGTTDSDDDSAGDQNARLQIAPRTGEWLIVVTSSELLRAGSFSLAVDGPRPRPTTRPLPRAAIALLPFERTRAAALPARVDTVRITKVDTVTITKVDTVLVTRVDTVTRTKPAPAARGNPPR